MDIILIEQYQRASLPKHFGKMRYAYPKRITVEANSLPVTKLSLLEGIAVY